MSYIPDLDANGMLSSLGANIANNVKQYRQKQLLSDLGKDLMGGDYNSAASKALAAGDMGTGLKLLELGRQRQQDATLDPIVKGLFQPQQQSQAAPQSGPQGSPAPIGGFDAAVNRTFGFEGGLNKRDTNGTPSNFGINAAANPDVNVLGLSKDGAKSIYKSRYWDAINGDKLQAQNPALAHVAFDTAVIAGPGKANELIQASGGDPNRLLDLRKQFQDSLIARDPQKYGPYAGAWNNRIAGLRADIGAGSSAPSAAMAYAETPLPPRRPAELTPSSSPYGWLAPVGTIAADAKAKLNAAMADNEDDGEEDTPAPKAQTVQGMLPGQPAPAAAPQPQDPLSRITPAIAVQMIQSGNPGYKALGEMALKRFSEANPAVKYSTISTPEQKKAEGIDPSDPRIWQKDSAGKLYPMSESRKAENDAEDNKAKVVAPGAAVVRNGKEIYRNKVDAGLSPSAIDAIAERNLAGDSSGMVGLGRGAQGAETIAAVRNREAEIMKERGSTPDQILDNVARFQGQKAGARSAGQMAAKLDILGNTVASAADYATELSNKFPRGQFVPGNQIQQMGQRAMSNPQLAAFSAATNTLVNEYARAIGGGVGTDASREHARQMLNEAQSPEAYAAVTNVLKREVQLAHAEARKRLAQGAGRSGQTEDKAGGALPDPLGIR